MVTFGTTTVGPMQLGVFVFMGILTLAGVCVCAMKTRVFESNVLGVR
jgi:hypothetical protein